MTIFPFRVYCDRDNGSSPRAYSASFHSAKPEGASYYAYDVIVHGRQDVEFIAFDMFCNVYGGVGREVFRFRARVGKGVTNDSVERRILAAAAERRDAELEAAEAAIVAGYADEIRTALDAVS